ncbi:hypothetical protein JXB28_01000 [Candidatus Woesearchaeota archaeon]|nr:hypothetical protein [Candidatus Woesearchaeota archaeon]
MEAYARGKRGVIYKHGKVCIKEKNPKSAVDTLGNETAYLEMMNKKGIGPKMIRYSGGKLYREFVEGIRIKDFFEQENDKRMIVSVIKQVLRQCREMDKLKINKKELTNPYKDIIITPDNTAVMIDFERCRRSSKPKNVTQFLQYISRNKKELEKKGIIIGKDAVMKLGKEYKEKSTDKNFDRIIKLVK